MADDDDVVCPLPALRKVRRRRQYTTGRRARTNGYEALDHDSRIIGRRTPAATHARPVVPRSAHARPSQACEPRCADVFKHYLACADRIEQKGAGAGAASLTQTAIVRHRRDRTTTNPAGDCEPYYFDWLKCIDKCAMPHIMQKLK